MSGKQLARLLNESCAFEYDYDDKLSPQKLSLISDFLQEIQYFDDVDPLDIRSQIDFDSAMGEHIEELDKNDLWVFVAKEDRIMTGGVLPDDNFSVTIINILDKSNPSIIKVDSSQKESIK